MSNEIDAFREIEKLWDEINKLKAKVEELEDANNRESQLFGGVMMKLRDHIHDNERKD
jgi:hypothetical protein